MQHKVISKQKQNLLGCHMHKTSKPKFFLILLQATLSVFLLKLTQHCKHTNCRNNITKHHFLVLRIFQTVEKQTHV